MGVDVKSVKELDILDLQDCELDRVFLHFPKDKAKFSCIIDSFVRGEPGFCSPSARQK